MKVLDTRCNFISMNEGTLRINEIFYSIQGESLLVGKPTVFIRTAACNLRCTWCDTRYAFWQGKLMSIVEITDAVRQHSTRYVCITGGEPLGQKATLVLIQELLDMDYTVSLETNGSFSIKDVPIKTIKVIDVKCPASGESDSFAWENFDLVREHDEFKFVIGSREDFEWAQKTCLERSLYEKCSVLYSPVHSKVNPKDLAEWILASSAPVTLQTQLHKELWDPNQRGV